MSLRTARLKSGKKVSDVMKQLCVSDAAVYQWEKGSTRPTVRHLEKLAAFYGCTMDELLKEENSNDH